jgi:Ni/Co efflux regulator RcnB
MFLRSSQPESMTTPLWPRPFVGETVMKLISRLLIAATLLSTGSLALAQDRRDHDQRGQGHGQGDLAMMAATTTIASRAIDATTTAVTVTAMRRAMTGIVTGSAATVMTARPNVVRDYGHYRLRPPPHGYHWVRAN